METALWLKYVVQFAGFNHVCVVTPPTTIAPKVGSALVARACVTIGSSAIFTITRISRYIIRQHPRRRFVDVASTRTIAKYTGGTYTVTGTSSGSRSTGTRLTIDAPVTSCTKVTFAICVRVTTLTQLTLPCNDYICIYNACIWVNIHCFATYTSHIYIFTLCISFQGRCIRGCTRTFGARTYSGRFFCRPVVSWTKVTRG